MIAIAFQGRQEEYKQLSDPNNQFKKKNTAFSGIKVIIGVSVVAQWLMNLTRNHEVVGSITGLAQRVEDMVLL